MFLKSIVCVCVQQKVSSIVLENEMHFLVKWILGADFSPTVQQCTALHLLVIAN